QSNFTDIQLSLDLTQDPCGKFVEIELFARPNDFSPFTSIGTITNFNQSNFTHFGAAAITDTWSYQLVYRYLCNGIEYYGDTLYIDQMQPVPSTFDSVSYDPLSGGIFLGWSQNLATDLFGYYLWENQNGNNFKFDSVYNQLGYLDQRFDPNTGQLFYALTAFDSCANQSVISTRHACPFLSGTSSNCGGSITINWTPYVGHTTTYYEVYLRLNGGAYFIDAHLDPTETSYQFQLASGDQAEVFVRAGLGNGFTSRSNPVQFQALDSFTVSANYLRSVSWVAPNTFEIDAYFDQSVDFDSLYLLRLNDPKPLILWQNITSNSPYPYTYSTKSDTLIYSYLQILTDRCGRHYYSDTAYNVVLYGTTTNVVDEYTLNWNQANYLDGGISSYTLNLGDDLSTYSTWNINQNDLKDTNTTTLITDEKLNLRCFQIITEENDPNHYGPGARVYSNPRCFIQAPSIFFPNVIAVHGINNEFRPVGLSIDKEKSSIEIYAKNGQRVFKGNLTTYWNGLHEDGGGYLTDAYLYIADIQFLNGERQHYSGTLTVIY
ncbi:MAG: fibronectin type III domain-containing protein, partial [Bacteroidia bacterium]